MKGMTTCKVCGRDFPLIFEEHKVVRDSGKKASLMGALTLQDEEALWDAFDCPHCGCQNVMQERKVTCPCDYGICDECDHVGESDVPEHDGCVDCKYEGLSESEEPCALCKHNYVDKWEEKDD